MGRRGITAVPAAALELRPYRPGRRGEQRGTATILARHSTLRLLRISCRNSGIWFKSLLCWPALYVLSYCVSIGARVFHPMIKLLLNLPINNSLGEFIKYLSTPGQFI